MTVLHLQEPKRTRTNTTATEVAPDPGASTDVEAVSIIHPEASQEQKVVATLRLELDEYLCRMKQLNSMGPDQVMLVLSGITARLTEVRSHLLRSESRRFTALRTREVDPLIVEAERQFRFHSRIQAIRQFDWDVSGRGQV